MAPTGHLIPMAYVKNYTDEIIIDQMESPATPFRIGVDDVNYITSVIVTEESQFARTISYSTSSIGGPLLVVGRILKVLITAIKSLKLTQDYNGTYIAYLSGQLTDDEFLNESSKYSYSPSSELTKDTIEDIKLLLETTKLEFSLSEIAEIFKLDHGLSLDAIKQLNIPMVER